MNLLRTDFKSFFSLNVEINVILKHFLTYLMKNFNEKRDDRQLYLINALNSSSKEIF